VLNLPDPFTRRAFLSKGLVLASAASTLPSFLENSALAMMQGAGDLGSRPGVPDERILVVVQLSGGNDGLNTVIPYSNPAYHTARPGIRVNERDALALNDEVGLHPRLTGLKQLHDDGLLSVVQGVGYPNPNRSHFVSMDIWHTADASATGPGWLGRYIDNECCGARPKNTRPPNESAAQPASSTSPAIALSGDAPLALRGRHSQPVSFESPELFRWTGDALGIESPLPLSGRGEGEGLAPPPIERSEMGGGRGEGLPESPNSALAFLTRTALDAQVSSDAIRRAARSAPLTNWPRSELAQQLQLVSAMIAAGLPTRVYYTSMGGFDTHAQQGGAFGRHAQLLQQFGDAMRAFYAELKAQRNDARVLTLCFSEFGRRVSQNASNGTDHGAAAPVFLAGPMVRKGVLNAHPSLTNLDDGDLRFSVDFRSVYAGVLADWLKADPNEVLGQRFRKAELLRKA
jgi:uncharacterized protein (DUF1501 family)